MAKPVVSVCWLRRDLRLEDNHALFKALQSPFPVLVIFIFDTEILTRLVDKRDKRVAFIHQTLQTLRSKMASFGSSIYTLLEKPEGAFEQILKTFEIREVYANHDYEPDAIMRDQQIATLLKSHGISFKTYKDQVIFERAEIVKADNSPYTVFTPYSKKWKQRIESQGVPDFPSEKCLSNLFQDKSFEIPSLQLLGFLETEPGLPDLDIIEKTIRNYHDTRNLPALKGTSQASPHLRFGTISVRILVKLALKWNDQWLNELIWREFFMMILYHFPQVVNRSFKPKYDNIPWRNNESEFELWCKGETGYPIVDAGMRQLNETGWMHNRVRMIVAGFLTKHLLIDWRWGEAYFAEKLLDYELSSNNGNWQWAAGSGCDAAPYFRIFNPTSQVKKFDPEMDYIKTWVKDFENYQSEPLVDHEFARKRALTVYKNALNDK